MFKRRFRSLIIIITFFSCQSLFADTNWDIYKSRFLMSDGRVIDSGNNNISHSEGQGYGMMFALMNNDRNSFESIWKWTYANLRNPQNELFFWRYDPVAPEPVTDRNNASDGDILIAWALLKAGITWNNQSYVKASDAITNSIQKYDVLYFANKQVLLPGASGFRHSSYLIINPSYFIFAAWKDFSRHSGRPIWDRLIQDSMSLLTNMGWGRSDLPTDWVKLSVDGSMVPADGWPAHSGYDAIRIPLYVSWYEPENKAVKVWQEWWRNYKRKQTPAWVDTSSGEHSNYMMSGGMLAVRDVIMNDPSLYPLRIEDNDDYYSASLKMLIEAMRKN